MIADIGIPGRIRVTAGLLSDMEREMIHLRAGMDEDRAEITAILMASLAEASAPFHAIIRRAQENLA